MRSMTGFGRGSAEDARMVVTCEVKQVNHRYLDVWLKLPEAYGVAEARLRQVVAESVKRGRIEVRLTRSYKPGAASAASFDDPAIARAIAALTRVKDHHGVPGVIDLRTLLLLPGFQETFTTYVAPDDKEVELSATALRQALAAAERMREQEGSALRSAVLKEIASVEAGAAKVSARSRENSQAVLQRMRERLAEIARDVAVDERRIAEEAAVWADRMDITEELARIASHVEQMRSYLDRDEAVGKHLDFLFQELVREANTIAAKARDASIGHEVVEMKAALERGREQAQNVE